MVIMNDILDPLLAMREEVDKAIIATSQGDDEACIKHADTIFELYKQIHDLYTQKIKDDMNDFLRKNKIHE